MVVFDTYTVAYVETELYLRLCEMQPRKPITGNIENEYSFYVYQIIVNDRHT